MCTLQTHSVFAWLSCACVYGLSWCIWIVGRVQSVQSDMVVLNNVLPENIKLANVCIHYLYIYIYTVSISVSIDLYISMYMCMYM